MNRITIPYIMGLLGVSLTVAAAFLIGIKWFATAEWMRDNRHNIVTIIGATIVAPWLVAIVRMRRPA
jgi:hypothetical protein